MAIDKFICPRVSRGPFQRTINFLPLPPGILNGHATPPLGQVRRDFELAVGTAIGAPEPVVSLLMMVARSGFRLL